MSVIEVNRITRWWWQAVVRYGPNEVGFVSGLTRKHARRRAESRYVRFVEAQGYRR